MSAVPKHRHDLVARPSGSSYKLVRLQLNPGFYRLIVSYDRHCSIFTADISSWIVCAVFPLKMEETYQYRYLILPNITHSSTTTFLIPVK